MRQPKYSCVILSFGDLFFSPSIMAQASVTSGNGRLTATILFARHEWHACLVLRHISGHLHQLEIRTMNKERFQYFVSSWLLFFSCVVCLCSKAHVPFRSNSMLNRLIHSKWYCCFIHTLGIHELTAIFHAIFIQFEVSYILHIRQSSLPTYIAFMRFPQFARLLFVKTAKPRASRPYKINNEVWRKKFRLHP